jgi:triosephosphate isomerase
LKNVSAELLEIAYEPVWAIGTGNTATPDHAQEVQANIRGLVERCSDERIAGETRILYGGSVKPENAKDLLRKEDIDGVLVGDCSLSLDAFESIVRS